MVLCFIFISCAFFLAAAEPPLPFGLVEEKDIPSGAPALPAGLEPDTGGPSLPSGLEPAATKKAASPQAKPDSGFTLPVNLAGFWETRFGSRSQEDPHEKEVSIGETRLQLQLEQPGERVTLKLTTDLLYDPVLDCHALDLETGQGWLDLREASILLRATDFLDLKAGRQILTWGTGDMLFINDLFPKDWNSFFIGRDDEYLKSPSDALKASLFSGIGNLDIVYTPRFDADRFIDGRRISYYNAFLGRRAGRDAIIDPLRPDDWFDDDELALRFYRNLSGYEAALYFYNGYWKSPGGMDEISGRAIFPKLRVLGASVRGPIANGIGNLEIGHYNSRDDRDGDNFMINNSQFRVLIGYEQELVKDFTIGMQYYVEYMLDHDSYQDTLPAMSMEADEVRQVVTLRLTRLMMNQNLKLSLFTYLSPSDGDAFLRPKINYQIDDHWSAELGGNIFWGEDEHTFFGQFEDNTNLYFALRFGF
ncbi:MAG: hypothetical protein JXA52_00855 [Planctomycetes bacterium]|nr:hypothetical protein [Planctomycetota bacterium]